MRFPIRVIYDFDEQEYVVFVEGIKEIEGRGETEAKAMISFFQKYEDVKDRDYNRYR